MQDTIGLPGKRLLSDFFQLWNRMNDEILSRILNRNFKSSEPQIQNKRKNGLTRHLADNNFLAFMMDFSPFLPGRIYLILSRKDLAILIDLIIGGDGTAPLEDFDDLHFNVIEETISQMAGTMESLLADNLLRKIEIRLEKITSNIKKTVEDKEMILAESEMQIDGFQKSTMEILIPGDFANELIKQLGEFQEIKDENAYSESIGNGSMKTLNQGGNVMYRKATFSNLDDDQEETSKPKLDILMDIPLEMTVVLGKTSINFKDLVELGPGSIFELEKMAGEPSEVYVNGRLVGYCEIIVIEENFGIRILETTENVVSSAQTGGGRKK